MDAQTDISNWVSSIPKITRYWFFTFFFVPLTTRFGLISYTSLLMVPELALGSFQIWRFLTSLVYYPVSFRWLMLLYFLYSYSQRLETGYFSGVPADYIFMLVFNAVVINIIGIFLSVRVLSLSLIFSVLYVWCQINKDSIVQFWFGIKVKAMYFPWVLFFFFFILGDAWQLMLIGIVVGHLYFFLTMKYPQEYGGRTLISTPQFLYNWFPSERHRMGGFGAPPTRRAQPADRGGAHNWGGGRRLDD